MRTLLLLLGVVLGAVAALAYVWFSADRSIRPAHPLADDPPISVTLGEPFLAAMVRLTPSQLEDAVVEAEDGVFVVKGHARVLGQPAIATVTLRPVVRNGELRIDVVRTEVGELPVPMTVSIEQQINRRIRALLADLPVTITAVTVVRDRGVTITCRVDLEALGARPP